MSFGLCADGEEFSMKKSDKPRAKFFVDKKSKLVHDAVIFMSMAAVIRMVGCWGLWNDRFFLITQIILPLVSAALFILCLRLGGEKLLVMSCVPVLMGAAFFVFRALGFETVLNTVLSISAAVVCALAYTFTVVGIIRTKWILPPLFALCFIFHVAVVDVAALRNTADPVLFSEGMQELSLLCTLLSMLMASLAVKRRKQLEDANLPKIKDPVVIVPRPKTEEAAAQPAADMAESPAVSAEANSAEETATAEKPAEGTDIAEKKDSETPLQNTPGADL